MIFLSMASSARSITSRPLPLVDSANITFASAEKRRETPIAPS